MAGSKPPVGDSATGGLPRRHGTSPERVLGALAASCGLWAEGSPATLDELLANFALERVRPEPSKIAL